ncbi:hypothetical protein [Holospora undulata]|uniref:Uncharacterized protein n=1 Tax=Holospora undulata HU1 TaxID=1321371 RepID=A0A061JGV8_9PROT|nr:hypothetical protein [Holospora undulata]ETZ05330.1 hypothetical protein K737_300229 [Holospora undulata HU1]
MKYINKILLIVVASGSFLSFNKSIANGSFLNFNKSIANGSKNNASCEDLNNYSIIVRNELVKISEYINNIQVLLGKNLHSYEILSRKLEAGSKADFSPFKVVDQEIINMMQNINGIFQLITIEGNKNSVANINSKSIEDAHKKIKESLKATKGSLKEIEEKTLQSMNAIEKTKEIYSNTQIPDQQSKEKISQMVSGYEEEQERIDKLVSQGLNTQQQQISERLTQRKIKSEGLTPSQSAPNLGNSRRSPLQSQENPEGQSTLMQKSASSVQLKNPQQ